MIGVYPDRLVYPPDTKGNINGRHSLDETLLDGYKREMERSGSSRFIALRSSFSRRFIILYLLACVPTFCATSPENVAAGS